MRLAAQSSVRESGRLIDDEQMLRELFKDLDKDCNGKISREEISDANAIYAEEGSAMKALILALDKKETSHTIEYSQFKDIADSIPRIKGHRVEWASTLGLDAALALHLRVGDLNDPLKGVRSMTDAELERACAAFSARDLFGLVKAGRDRLLTSVNTVREFVNSKFRLDEACTMSFADLDTYYNGSEAIIGAPNPNVDIG